MAKVHSLAVRKARGQMGGMVQHLWRPNDSSRETSRGQQSSHKLTNEPAHQDGQCRWPLQAQPRMDGEVGISKSPSKVVKL